MKVTELATAVATDEKTVLDWIKNRGLPAHKQDDRYRINRVDLLEWATGSGIIIPPELFEVQEDSIRFQKVSEALSLGGIYYDISGDSPEAVLRQVVACLSLPPFLDPEFLLQTLLAREALGSTAFGNGIAIPHARSPIVSQAEQSSISLCFLERSIDFNAVDGKPVNILFTLVTSCVKAHLQLLARLAFILHDHDFQTLLHRPGEAAEIMAAITALEETMPGR